ncbi:MAG: hypothetical protein JWR70_3129, partial [Modestobacter sp.]|nr:hypothetical protein [Modestobacter sp.]
NSHCIEHGAAAGTASAADGHSDVAWFNPQDGTVSAWLLNGTQTVQRRFDLDWRCDAASGCSANWRAIGIGDVA